MFYETPGGTLLLTARRAMESITLDRDAGHLKDSLMPRYAELVYNGFWFAPEREALQALIDTASETVTGTVRLKALQGQCHACWAAKAPNSLYSAEHVTLRGGRRSTNQGRDAQGFTQAQRPAP